MGTEGGVRQLAVWGRVEGSVRQRAVRDSRRPSRLSVKASKVVTLSSKKLVANPSSLSLSLSTTQPATCVTSRAA